LFQDGSFTTITPAPDLLNQIQAEELRRMAADLCALLELQKISISAGAMSAII
jgi:hypothetical protein